MREQWGQFVKLLFAAALLAALSLGASAVLAAGPYQHVLLISIDGMHAIDLANYAAGHPSSTSSSPGAMHRRD